MWNNKVRAILAIYILIITSGLIQSCCEFKYNIVSIDYMKAWEMSEDGTSIYIDTIRGEFYLDTYLKFERIANLESSLVNSAYATTCNEIYVNTIDKSSIELSLDRAFVYNGEVINAEINILALDGIDVELNNFISVYFSESFFSKSNFENEKYNFTMKASTSDDIIVESNISLNINIR